MKVFGFPVSPFVRKVHLVAAEKGIAVTPVIGRPGEPQPDFIAASPFLKIPAIKDGDFLLSDSTAISIYMDALVPDPPILPTQARERARAAWFEEFADTIMFPPGEKISTNRFIRPKVLRVDGDEALAAEGIAAFREIQDYLEREAPAQGWLAGRTFSIGDIAVASILKSLSYSGFAPDPSTHPRTAGWYERVCARPAWRDVILREDAVLAQVVDPPAGVDRA